MVAGFLPRFEFGEVRPEFYAHVSVQLGEWYESGFYKPDDSSWRWDAYSEEQYQRVCQKFLNRYYYREVSTFSPGQWKTAYLRKFNELMPKYKYLYEKLEDGFKPFLVSDEYEKGRDIFSDFPATLLTGNEDYASTGNDSERERVVEGDSLAKWQEFVNRYNDIDVQILDDVESTLFSGLITVTAPRF